MNHETSTDRLGRPRHVFRYPDGWTVFVTPYWGAWEVWEYRRDLDPRRARDWWRLLTSGAVIVRGIRADLDAALALADSLTAPRTAVTQ